MTMAETPPETERETGTFTFLDRQVTLMKPSPGQAFIMLAVLSLQDTSAELQEHLETVVNFGTMLKSLFVEPDEDEAQAGFVGRSYVLGALARNTADLEDFIDLAGQMGEAFDIGEETAHSRQERRARERRPAVAVKGRR